MTRKAHRMPPITLYTMCKRLTLGMYTKLKAHNEVYFTANTTNWRLIDYYYRLDGEWSKAREEEDLSDIHDLPGHKHHTLRWLMRKLGQIGQYPTASMLHLMMEMENALAFDAIEWVIYVAPEAIMLAESLEEFHHLRIFLAIERQALDRVHLREDVLHLIQENYRKSQEAVLAIAEIDRQEGLRIMEKELIQMRRKGEPADRTDFRLELEKYAGHSFRSKSAEVLYKCRKALDFGEDGLTSHHVEVAKSALALLHATPGLIQRDESQYLWVLQTTILFLSQLGQHSEAVATLLLSLEATKDLGTHSISKKMMEAFLALFLGVFAKNEALKSHGLQLVSDLGEQRISLYKGYFQGQVRFFEFRARIENGDYRGAWSSIQRFQAAKPKCNPLYVMHFRLLGIVCLVELGEQSDFVISWIRSSATYFRKHLGKRNYMVQFAGCMESILLRVIGEREDKPFTPKGFRVLQKMSDQVLGVSANEIYPYSKWLDTQLAKLKTAQTPSSIITITNPPPAATL